MKKTLYFSLIMLGATAIVPAYAYRIDLKNETDKPVKFYVHRAAAPKRSRTVQPGKEDWRSTGLACITSIDFHIVEPDGKDSKQKATFTPMKLQTCLSYSIFAKPSKNPKGILLEIKPRDISLFDATTIFLPSSDQMVKILRKKLLKIVKSEKK